MSTTAASPPKRVHRHQPDGGDEPVEGVAGERGGEGGDDQLLPLVGAPPHEEGDDDHDGIEERDQTSVPGRRE